MFVRQPNVPLTTGPGVVHFPPAPDDLLDIFGRRTRGTLPDWCRPINMHFPDRPLQP